MYLDLGWRYIKILSNYSDKLQITYLDKQKRRLVLDAICTAQTAYQSTFNPRRAQIPV